MPGTITIRDKNLPNKKRRYDFTKLMPTTLGTAKWFEFPKDVRPAFEHGDLFLGKTLDGDPLGVRNRGHILACAGTRSGKGTSLIIPNIILAQGSIMVIDPKGENAIVTARERANGSKYSHGKKQKVVLLDPLLEVRTKKDSFSDLRGCFNPLDLLRQNKDEAIDYAARIADALVVSENNNESFWDDSAKDLIAAISLHVASSKGFNDGQRNLCMVRDLIHTGYHKLRTTIAANDPKGRAPSAYHLMFRAMSKNKAYDGEVANQGQRFMMLEDQSGRTMAGAAQVAMTNLNFLASKQMRACVSKSSFKLSDLKTDAKGVSLYLCLPQRYAETHFRWLRMMTTLTLAEMERVKGRPRSGHSILMVLDEFASLRRMKVIENAAAAIAGNGVQMAFIVQSLVQLKSTYSDNWEVFTANSSVKVFFCNQDHFTRDYVSRLVGECQLVKTAHNTSQSQGRSSSNAQGTSHSVSNNSGNSSTSGWSTGGDAKGGMQFSGSSSISSGHSTTSGLSFTDTHGTSDSTGKNIAQSFHKRHLINPDEVGKMFGDHDNPHALVLIENLQPLIVKRCHYYNLKNLRGHYDPHPDHAPPLMLDALGIKKDWERREKDNCEREARLLEQRRRAQERADAQAKADAQFEAWTKEQRRNAMQYQRSLLKQQKREWWLWFRMIVFGAVALCVGPFLFFAAAYKSLVVFMLIIIYCAMKTYSEMY